MRGRSPHATNDRRGGCSAGSVSAEGRCAHTSTTTTRKTHTHIHQQTQLHTTIVRGAKGAKMNNFDTAVKKIKQKKCHIRQFHNTPRRRSARTYTEGASSPVVGLAHSTEHIPTPLAWSESYPTLTLSVSLARSSKACLTRAEVDHECDGLQATIQPIPSELQARR